METYRTWAAEAPEELTTVLNVRRAPAAPWIPEPLHGVPVWMIVACWCGPIEDGEAVIAPIRALGPTLDLFEPKPWRRAPGDVRRRRDAGVALLLEVGRARRDRPSAAVDAIVDHTERITSPRSYAVAFQLGGAMSRVGEMDTAYAGRSPAFDVNINGVWLPEGAEGAPRPRGVGPVAVRRARAEGPRRLRELPRRRGRRPRSGGVRRREVRAPRRAEDALGPDQPVPLEPEHRARAPEAGSCSARMGNHPVSPTRGGHARWA